MAEATHKTSRIHFQDVTETRDAADYINNLGEGAFVIYSPKALHHVSVNNPNVQLMDYHTFERSIKLIRDLIESKKQYTTIVSLGGGTATDIAKYIAFETGAMFTCIPSMLSTNSFATDKVALVVDDGKVTLDAKMADKIILDISLLGTAPQQNLYGLADVLSIHTALKDWKLANTKDIETIDEDIYDQASDLVSKAEKFVIDNDIDHILSDIPSLFAYIGESGYITNLHGTGRSESGSEHIFAKALEKQIDMPHGVSISLGILLMSILQDNYSTNIAKAIEKMGTLHPIDQLGITRKMLRDVLINLKPRKDRYSILDEVILDDQKIDETIDKFAQLTSTQLS